jgi:hypothetical protein
VSRIKRGWVNKLLLILIVSFTFSGSANANSIEGAFGYKLGQVVKGMEIYEDWSGFKNRNESFTPVKPMPPFNSYVIRSTLKTNKVYEINISHFPHIKMENYYSCSGNRYFIDLSNALENKYGDSLGIWDDYNGWTVTEINNGDRSIHLKCVQWTGSKNNPLPNDEMQIVLKYIDIKLYKLAQEESNQYSDYDL